MKSKSSTFILVVVIIVVVGILIYFFAIKGGKSPAPATSGLVSTTSGTAGVPTSAAAGSPGAQVVALLRNLSAIQLDDAVFRNPSFALLQDLSIQLPPIVNQGRRNPFAPVGTDTFNVAPVTQAQTQTASPTSTSSGGPSAN